MKTEQVRSGNHASYSYTHEVNSQPVVHTHSHVAAAPALAPVASVPTAYHYASAYHYPTYAHYYSPYSFVLGK